MSRAPARFERRPPWVGTRASTTTTRAPLSASACGIVRILPDIEARRPAAMTPGAAKRARTHSAHGSPADLELWGPGRRFRTMTDFWLQLSMAAAAGLETADQPAYNILLSLRPWSEITLFAMGEDVWGLPDRNHRNADHEGETSTAPTGASADVGRQPVLHEQRYATPRPIASRPMADA